MATIMEKRQLTPVTKMLRVDAPLIAASARAGQFVIVRVRERGERIPLTITDYDRERGLVTIVVQEVGVTTRLLGSLEEGEDILDIVGPRTGDPVGWTRSRRRRRLRRRRVVVSDAQTQRAGRPHHDHRRREKQGTADLDR
jgi:ferredoxin--NADP+ reductase